MRPPYRGTRLRGIRVPDPLWEDARTVADARGENLSEHVLRPALTRYVKHNKHLLNEEGES